MGIRKAERLARGRREEAGEPVVTGASDGDPIRGFVQRRVKGAGEAVLKAAKVMELAAEGDDGAQREVDTSEDVGVDEEVGGDVWADSVIHKFGAGLEAGLDQGGRLR